MNIRFTLLVGLSFLTSFSYAQKSNNEDLKTLEVAGWYRYTGSENIGAEAFLEKFHQEIGLSTDDQLIEKRRSLGMNGSEHIHYQQHHKGVPVEAGDFIVHLRNGAVYLANGEIVSDINQSSLPTLNEAAAFAKALENKPANLYAWQTNEGNRPLGELFFIDDQFSKSGSNYRLSWKFDVFSFEPYDRNWVYINAQTGALEHSLTRIHTHDTATAETKYHSTQTIYTSFDSDSSKYVLRDSLTGGGFFTYNMQQRTLKSTAVDFYDDDNYWNNFNAQLDEAATDAHWGAERVYTYFKQHYNRLSYDDNNSPFISYVHFDSAYFNAFWNGQEMTYGDGNGTTTTPLTPIDIVAHEITHGITQFTAGLIYQGEAGALNESFSDIFGAAIEFAYDSANGDWKMGEDVFVSNNNGIRNLRNPSLFSHPDTYQGANWNAGLFIDNGYVHSHSGVQNHWYYLLSDGDFGTNDNGDAFSIKGIGYQKAADIAYQNLSNYLTRFSDHDDARMGAMQAAIDLFGLCSEEYIQCTNAWYAVGVGAPTGDLDLSLDLLEIPARACSMTSSEDIIFGIRNSSCNRSFLATDSIELNYRINGGAMQTAKMVLGQNLAPNATINLVHPITADFSAIANYTVNATFNFVGDTLVYNNGLNQITRNRSYQNHDWKLHSILSPISGCDLSDSTQITVEVIFYGCDSATVGQVLNLNYQELGGTVQTTTGPLPKTLHYGDTARLSFPATLNLEARGVYRHTFEIIEPLDPETNNNRIANYASRKPFDLIGGLISFEGFDFVDSLLILHPPMSSGRRANESTIGSKGYEIVGGGLINYGLDFTVPRSDSAVWSSNEAFRSTLCTCIDAENEGALQLRFDLRQSYNDLIRRLRSESSSTPYSSSLRVLVNGQSASATFIPSTNNDTTWKAISVNLDTYAGTYFELCLETHTMLNPRTNSITNFGDAIFLDNIRIDNSGISISEESHPETFAIKVYPNPSNGNFTISLDNAEAGTYKISLQDAMGRSVYSKNISTQEGAQMWDFHSVLAPGTYFILVQNPQGFAYSEQLIIH
jgi:Zn-dependent metalloprotease